MEILSGAHDLSGSPKTLSHHRPIAPMPEHRDGPETSVGPGESLLRRRHDHLLESPKQLFQFRRVHRLDKVQVDPRLPRALAGLRVPVSRNGDEKWGFTSRRDLPAK